MTLTPPICCPLALLDFPSDDLTQVYQARGIEWCWKDSKGLGVLNLERRFREATHFCFRQNLAAAHREIIVT
jgi:hypothetical protein